jgi:hypothetical protein
VCFSHALLTRRPSPFYFLVAFLAFPSDAGFPEKAFPRAPDSLSKVIYNLIEQAANYKQLKKGANEGS